MEDLKMKPVRFCMTLCMSVALTCCSVKEDRTVCPCRLFLDMNEIDNEVVEYASVFLTGSDGFIFKDIINSKDLSEHYFVDVPHGQISVWVSYGAGVDGVGPDGIIVPAGNEFPEIYMHHSWIDASGESVREKVILNKNHCNITICLSASGEFPYCLELKGNVNGYHFDGTLSEGDFSYVMDVGDDGICEVSVPRQSDDSLRLEVRDESGTLRVFAIGEYISASGYDWTEPDLRDLTIGLDYSLTNLTLILEDWDNEYHYSVII